MKVYRQSFARGDYFVTLRAEHDDEAVTLAYENVHSPLVPWSLYELQILESGQVHLRPIFTYAPDQACKDKYT